MDKKGFQKLVATNAAQNIIKGARKFVAMRPVETKRAKPGPDVYNRSKVRSPTIDWSSLTFISTNRKDMELIAWMTSKEFPIKFSEEHWELKWITNYCKKICAIDLSFSLNWWSSSYDTH